jgi:Holliday junction resolvase-like predicted endonuclease
MTRSIENYKSKIILSILRLSVERSLQKKNIRNDTQIPEEVINDFLLLLAKNQIINIQKEDLEISRDQRIQLAAYAIEKGAEIEKVSKYLKWGEFESLTALILEKNGYRTQKHFRFRHDKKGAEIDVLGFKEPFILSVDCKHWKKSWQKSATIKAIKAQLKRTYALVQCTPILKDKIKITDWKETKIIPILVTLSVTPFKLYENVPVIPIYYFQNFLLENPLYEDKLKVFTVK